MAVAVRPGLEREPRSARDQAVALPLAQRIDAFLKRIDDRRHGDRRPVDGLVAEVGAEPVGAAGDADPLGNGAVVGREIGGGHRPALKIRGIERNRRQPPEIGQAAGQGAVPDAPPVLHRAVGVLKPEIGFGRRKLQHPAGARRGAAAAQGLGGPGRYRRLRRRLDLATVEQRDVRRARFRGEAIQYPERGRAATNYCHSHSKL